MKRLLLTTAIGLALGTAALAQTAADPAKTNTPPAAQAAAPNTPATAGQPASVTLSAGVSVTEPDRTRLAESIARMSVKPLRGVDFSVSVGSHVPRELRVYRLPAEFAEIVPPYRDYRFLVVEKDIVIVEPSANKIVAILPRDPAITTATSAAPTAAPAPAPTAVTPLPATPTAAATAAPTTAAPTTTATTAAPTAAPATPAPATAATVTSATTSAAAASLPAASAPASSTPSAQAPDQASTAQASQASVEPERPKVKKQASRSQRMSRAARDEARWARAEVRVGQRVPDHVPLYVLPSSASRELMAREYNSAQRGVGSRVAGSR